MPRPRKCRRVCCMPGSRIFAPVGEEAKEQTVVMMTVDEFETIRLIDLDRLSQEECAERMNVARTTAQAIYNSARLKLAEFLISGTKLSISGGDYVLCDGNTSFCGCKRCDRNACRLGDTNDTQKTPFPNSNQSNSIKQKTESEKNKMKIAVTYEDGQVFQHFGSSRSFKIYDVTDGKVVGAVVVNTIGSGHNAVAGMLSNLEVDAVICGGIGDGAKRGLDEAGIKLYGSVTGEADEAVALLLAGTLVFDPNATHSHHGEHQDEHEGASVKEHDCASCGEENCGERK